MFKHHYIATDLPDKENSNYSIPVLADFDKDGDLDFAFSITKDKVFWFKCDDGSWTRHVIGEIPTGQLGANVMDVDGDDWADIVVGGYWYRNPQNPKQQHFERY